MSSQAYFTAASMNTMLHHLNAFGIEVKYDKHKDANVLILLHTGVYLLSSVKAPNRNCSTYFRQNYLCVARCYLKCY